MKILRRKHKVSPVTRVQVEDLSADFQLELHIIIFCLYDFFFLLTVTYLF